MKITQEMKKIYNKIQMQVYNMIPEKWSEIYVYSAIIEHVKSMTTGEMFFYYYPKSVIKNKVVNLYEIPTLFKLDETEYDTLINRLYLYMQELREACIRSMQPVWTNVTIAIKSGQFSIEYNYDDLNTSNLSEFERHVLWKYKYLKKFNQYNRREMEVIRSYLMQEERLRRRALPNPDYLPENVHMFNSNKMYSPMSVNTVVEAKAMNGGNRIYSERINSDRNSPISMNMNKKARMGYVREGENNNHYNDTRRRYEEYDNYDDIEEEAIPSNAILTTSMMSRKMPNTATNVTRPVQRQNQAQRQSQIRGTAYNPGNRISRVSEQEYVNQLLGNRIS